MEESSQSLPDFQDRTVVFYLRAAGYDHAPALDSPTFESQGGRLFIVGKQTKVGSGHWAEGQQFSIAWDEVQMYVVFSSPADYKALRSSRRKTGETGLFGLRRR